MRRFYREASPDYARWIRRNLFEMLRSERIPSLRPLPTAHNPVLRMIAGKWTTCYATPPARGRSGFGRFSPGLLIDAPSGKASNGASPRHLFTKGPLSFRSRW